MLRAGVPSASVPHKTPGHRELPSEKTSHTCCDSSLLEERSASRVAPQGVCTPFPLDFAPSPFSFADFSLHPLTAVNRSHESEHILSPVSPPSKSRNQGGGPGTRSPPMQLMLYFSLKEPNSSGSTTASLWTPIKAPAVHQALRHALQRSINPVAQETAVVTCFLHGSHRDSRSGYKTRMKAGARERNTPRKTH